MIKIYRVKFTELQMYRVLNELDIGKEVLRRIYFLFFQLWRLVFLEPSGVQRHYVPHFKALIYGNMELQAQGRDNTFTFCHAQFKKDILLHKMATVWFVLLLTVCTVGTVNDFPVQIAPDQIAPGQNQIAPGQNQIAPRQI